MGLFPSWIQLWCLSLIIPSKHQCTESPQIQICTYLGTVTTNCLQSSEWLTSLKRAKTVCSNHHLLKEEEECLSKALRKCKYPAWALNRVNIKQKNKNTTNQGTNKKKNNTGSNSKPYMSKAWVRDARTSAENMGSKCVSKEATSSRISWYTLKIETQSYRRVVWSMDSSMAGWTVKKSTLGESGRTFAERFREHMRVSSPILDHHNITGHKLSLDNFIIVGREDQCFSTAIKEAILIRVNGPSLNRNIGKHQLPHVWDEVLVKSPELKLNWQPITSGPWWPHAIHVVA